MQQAASFHLPPSLTSPLEAVRHTTSILVQHEAAKPRAHQSKQGAWQPTAPSSPSSSSAHLDPALCHVWLDHDRLRAELEAHPNLYHPSALPPSWAQWYHYCELQDAAGERRTAQYVFVLDSLNFCFWPLQGYEYSDLAAALKRTLLADAAAFDAQRLVLLEEEELQRWLQPPSPELKQSLMQQAQRRLDTGSRDEQLLPAALLSASCSAPVPIPLLSARCRCLQELGAFLLRQHGGSAHSAVQSCASASQLVEQLLQHVPSFRDACLHLHASGCSLTHFYKRAQILAADVAAALQLSQWADLHRLTCFADYRLPQLLMALGILQVGDELRAALQRGRELEPGSGVEVSLRAHTVQAVEAMVQRLQEAGSSITAMQLDWILWERGEAQLHSLPPHHRTRTIYY